MGLKLSYLIMRLFDKVVPINSPVLEDIKAGKLKVSKRFSKAKELSTSEEEKLIAIVKEKLREHCQDIALEIKKTFQYQGLSENGRLQIKALNEEETNTNLNKAIEVVSVYAEGRAEEFANKSDDLVFEIDGRIIPAYGLAKNLYGEVIARSLLSVDFWESEGVPSLII